MGGKEGREGGSVGGRGRCEVREQRKEREGLETVSYTICMYMYLHSFTCHRIPLTLPYGEFL